MVSPLLVRAGHRLLRCPVCQFDLTGAAGALVCRNRHSFDLSREGYVNLLSGRRRRWASGGDSLEQLRHRAAFLDAGYFDDIAATIAEHAEQSCTSMSGAWRILDAGFGTGHHLARIAEVLLPDVVGIGLDISRDAARQAARRWPTLGFAVTDLWTEWPVQSAAVDLVMSIFAPKNFSEAARVLRPGGLIAVAYPGVDHMIELRDRFALMRRYEAAAQLYTEAVRHFVGLPRFLRLRRRAVLDNAAIRNAILMGPNARHLSVSALDAELGPLAVTFDVTVSFARKK
jgi:23S rRNA (guanine745-N1)-methyltransferase